MWTDVVIFSGMYVMFDLVMLLFCLFILSVQFWDVVCFFTM